ncbi:MAG TPA: NAD(P)-dependent oxidoreductase [Blastocatellia bacterium]|nr:NAD(P)-dependent oxidoreductase [Blastocatellia bacterium]
MKIGFVGLGSMGFPMASNLLKAGHTLAVYNRTVARAEELAKQGAAVAASPAEAARNADVLITMLSDDAAVKWAIFGESGDGACTRMKGGAIHISMSTISVACSVHLADWHAHLGHGYVAAPVFGRPMMAAAAELTILAAGPAAIVARCQPLFEVLGKTVHVVSDNAAAANLVKITGNFTLAAVLEALGEAFALVRKSGIDPAIFLKIISSVYRSPVYEGYGRLIAEQLYEPAGFKLKLGLKDVRLALRAADDTDVPMPLASLLHDRFLAGASRGLADKDWASLAALIASDAGL